MISGRVPRIIAIVIDNFFLLQVIRAYYYAHHKEPTKKIIGIGPRYFI